MEWRSIPGFEAYEVNARGKVRRVASKYVITQHGRQVRLWDGTSYQHFHPQELVALAFAEPAEETEADPAIEAEPYIPGEVELLRVRIAELEAELAVYRVEL